MIEVIIPMEPPSELLPNRQHRRGGHYPGVAATKECRQVARYAAMASGVYIEPFAGPVTLTIHAAYGYKRVTPDLQATISACKAFVDGLADAGIIEDDDQVKKIVATHEKLKGRRGEKPQGYTRIQIERMD